MKAIPQLRPLRAHDAVHACLGAGRGRPSSTVQASVSTTPSSLGGFPMIQDLGEKPVDRCPPLRVTTSRRRTSAREVLIPMKTNSWPLSALLILLLVGCGGRDKGAGTTPAGGADGQGMDDQNPVGTGVTPGSAGEPGADQPADGSDPGIGDDSVAGVDTGSEPAPGLAPPNLDADPAEVKQVVSQHLQAGEKALSGSKRDPDEALKQARLALEADATSIDAAVLLALAYYHKRLYDTAEVVLDVLTTGKGERQDRAQKHAGVFYAYGLVYDATDNDSRRAFVNYQKAVQLDPSHTSALINYGVHLLENKQYDESVKVFERLTGPLNQKTAITWTNLGSAYRGRSASYDGGPRNDLLKRAEAAYERALQLDKNYGPAYYNLGLLYLDADKYPGPSGPMDKLDRLKRAKSYFEKYQSAADVRQDLLDEQMKLVVKLISREEKSRKQKKDANW